MAFDLDDDELKATRKLYGLDKNKDAGDIKYIKENYIPRQKIRRKYDCNIYKNNGFHI